MAKYLTSVKTPFYFNSLHREPTLFHLCTFVCLSPAVFEFGTYLGLTLEKSRLISENVSLRMQTDFWLLLCYEKVGETSILLIKLLIWLDQGKHAVASVQARYSVLHASGSNFSWISVRWSQFMAAPVPQLTALFNNVEWEAGASDTQRSLRKEKPSYLLVAKIFMPKAESDKSHW